MAEQLVRDHHPVEVYAPDVRPAPIGGCRVFITEIRDDPVDRLPSGGRLIVWARDPDSGQPVKLLEEQVTRGLPDRNRGTLLGQLSMDTAGQGTVYITRGTGCGCHSPLKALSAPVDW